MARQWEPRTIEDVPVADVIHQRRWSLPLVWLIPLVAALAGGWLAVKAVMDRGPTAAISFKTAEGLEAGKTKIKYKNIDVGEVTQVIVSEDLHHAVAKVQLDKRAAPYLVDDTRFWIVRPRFSGGQITGLGTLFTGSYIGVDIGQSTHHQTEFIGLETPPVVEGDEPGRQFVLHGRDLGSVEIGSPVYFRREQVGRVLAHALDRDGTGVTVRIFIDAPSDRYVNSNTRFWNASGVDITADTTGFKVHTQSIVSLLFGGIAFETPDSTMAQPVDEKTVFPLFTDQRQAMKLPDLESDRFTLYFLQSLRGLSVGAPVDISGVPIGEVISIGVESSSTVKALRFPVEVAIYPDRLWALARPGSKPSSADRKSRIDGLVESGLRAQLREGSLLSGQLYIALDFFPDAPKAEVDWTKTPPVWPSVPGGFQDLELTVASIAKKIDKMQLDQIGTDLHQTLRSLTETLHTVNVMVKRVDSDITPAARETLDESRQMFKTTRQAFADDAPLQHDLRTALRDLSRASQSVRLLGDYLERHPESLLRGKK